MPSRLADASPRPGGVPSSCAHLRSTRSPPRMSSSCWRQGHLWRPARPPTLPDKGQTFLSSPAGPGSSRRQASRGRTFPGFCGAERASAELPNLPSAPAPWRGHVTLHDCPCPQPPAQSPVRPPVNANGPERKYRASEHIGVLLPRSILGDPRRHSGEQEGCVCVCEPELSSLMCTKNN